MTLCQRISVLSKGKENGDMQTWSGHRKGGREGEREREGVGVVTGWLPCLQQQQQQISSRTYLLYPIIVISNFNLLSIQELLAHKM